jgi:perosamine synthetase
LTAKYFHNMKIGMKLPSDAEASGRRFGASELSNLSRVLESGTLNCTRGTFVTALENEFADRYAGAGWYCTAVTSGTAAIHCAVAALKSEPGDEIITTSITDMGALTPILYQGAVPVFADIDRQSFNISAESIEAVLTERTRAIIVTHLFGTPCDMKPILDLAHKRSIPVIEDAAQAPYATYGGVRVGTMGSIGCFSLQQGKHMTCGEGGLVITNDETVARHIRLFHDKAWGYGDANPDHYFLAPNYRMTELQGAVALAQLDKVEQVVQDRQTTAGEFLHAIAEVAGVQPQVIPPQGRSVFWKMTLRLDPVQTGADVREIGSYLKEKFGVVCAPRYVQKPAFECEIFRNKRTFGASEWPLRDVAPPDPSKFQGTYDALANMLVLPWNENYTAQHVDYLADSLRATIEHFQG